MDLFPTDMYTLVYDGKNGGSGSSSDDVVVDDGDDVCGTPSTQISLLGYVFAITPIFLYCVVYEMINLCFLPCCYLPFVFAVAAL
jgi:hypothetical protein